MKTNEFTGTGALIRLILRRDRLMLAIWIVVVSLIPLGNASSAAALYPTPAAMATFAEESINNPTVRAVHGPIYSQTIGGFAAWRSVLQVALFIIIPSLVLMIRHTRSEEEAGRRELLGSTVVGRHAPLTAAFIVLFGASLMIGFIIAVSLIAIGLPWTGAIVLGLALASAGWLFIALAGVAAQLTESAGSAGGITGAILGAFLLLRFANNSALLPWWLSPFSWIAYTRAFAGEQWSVFTLIITPVIALTILAYSLSARRDLGSGILTSRPGPATASSALDNPLALAWRLHRSTLFSWIAGAVLFGIALGSVAQSMSSMVGAQLTDWMITMNTRDQGDALLLIMIYVFSQSLPLYAIQSALYLRAEENFMRVDFILSAPVSRLRWAISHLFFAFVGPAVILLIFGLVIGVVYGLSVGNLAGELPRLLIRTLMTLPAVWVALSVVVALYGLLPKFVTAIGWAIFAAILLLEAGWELQLVSQSVFNISPFAYVHWTIAQIPVLSMTVLVGLAALLTGIGLFRFQVAILVQ